ncbi:MAG: hypothetical protein ABWZ25_13140 [Chitinophagaceae bacterium]
MIIRKHNYNWPLFFVLLLGSFAGKAQSSGVSELRETIEKKSGHQLSEKLFVHTDKDFYLSGELCWFRIFSMDAFTLLPGSPSRVCYVEIIDGSGKAGTQAKIVMDSTGGSGSFYLPVSLNTGNYTLRAYTSWMKNSGPSTFFEKKLTIVNTLKNSETILAKDSFNIIADFLAEGGQLVNDLEGRMAFRLRSASGTPVSADITVITANGDTIAHARASAKGMGSFTMTPTSGLTYKANILLPDGRTVVKQLPAAERSGYTLVVTESANGDRLVTVRSNIPSQQGRPVYLLAHRAGKVYSALQQNIQVETSWTIKKSELPAGTTTITLFDSRQQPVAERLVFNKPETQETLVITGNKSSYGIRDKVALSVEYKGADLLDYSTSVYLLDSFQSAPATITDYLLLTDELKGQVEDPNYYFSPDPDVNKHADDLMLTAGWRTFRNKQSAPSLAVLPESSGHIITARVLSLPGETPAADVVCYFSAGASPYEFLISKSDSNGLVHFNAKKYYGPGDIIIQPQSWQGTTFRIDVVTPFLGGAAPASPFFTISEDLRDQLREKSVAMQAMNVFATDSISRFVTPTLFDTLPFYGNAEFSYPLDDYKRFTTMEEVMREYITPVGVIMRNGKPSLTMYDYEQKILYRKELVLLLLDGIPLQDPDKLFTIDPLKIRKIDVIPSVYLYGPSLFTGVISLESYNGHSEGIELDKNLVTVDYEGLQLKRAFYAPDYSVNPGSRKRMPDMRNTLLWIPQVSIGKGNNSKLNFYTSDIKGRFLVLVQGLSSTGVPVAGMQTFSVE